MGFPSAPAFNSTDRWSPAETSLLVSGTAPRTPWTTRAERPVLVAPLLALLATEALVAALVASSGNIPRVVVTLFRALLTL
jgi:hypothetical protein